MLSDHPPAALAPTAERLARALGPKFQVLRLLGHGGFAEVYEVRDTELRRRLAVKVLRPDLPWGPRTLHRFLREARTLARLNHPHILPIHFVGEGEGLVFYAMPFLEGCSLAQLLRRDGALNVPRALAIAFPVVEALRHAHEHGIVHRDVKPDNIVIEAATGRPLLVDFGIARSLDGDGHQTESGFVVGTPLYMSPEQALGRSDVDARADLYAVGAVLFEVLTGAPPFSGCDSQEIVGRHIGDPVPVGALSRDGIPGWLRDVIVRCLAKRPEERYPSAQALLEALRQGRANGGGSPSVRSGEEAASATADSDGVAVSTPRSGDEAAFLDSVAFGTPETTLAYAGFGERMNAAVSGGRGSGEEDITPTELLPAARRRVGVLAAAGALLMAGVFGVVLRPKPVSVARTSGVSEAAAFSEAAAVSEIALTVENRLVQPIAVTVVGGDTLVLEPGGSIRVPAVRGRRLVAHWAAVRPTALDGRTMGEQLEGTVALDQPTSDTVAVVNRQSAGGRRVAPLVVNGTRHAVRAAVIVAGDTIGCGCFISPGDSLQLGYYSLAPESVVLVTDALGRAARLTGLDTLARDESGLVALRVTRGRMRPVPR